jgi:GTP pyrophosphokinase
MPELCNELVRKVAKRKEEQEEYLKEVTGIVTGKLKEEGIPGQVSWRIKHYYGIYQKMQKQEITFEQVHDVLGLRIITDTRPTVMPFSALSIPSGRPCQRIQGLYRCEIKHVSSLFLDHHRTERRKGQFQIRTARCICLRSMGLLHWRYKEKGKWMKRATDTSHG